MNTDITSPPASSKNGPRRANALSSDYLLDEYRIDSILGAGGFGVTYKALDTHLQSWVAIKEYFPVEWSFRDADGITVHANTQGLSSASDGQTSDYEWGLERFLDEARVLARIQHPYVVRVKRYFRANGTAYIVMEYEEGAPLSAILDESPTLSENEVRGLLEDVLPALQAVHEQGYLHRDIKPANLYVRASDHRVMLIDFGAARAAISRHTQNVTSLVTPGYSPPEQYTTRNDRYGAWTDIYALGAVLYRCVTGHTPAEAAERLMDDTLEPAVTVGSGRYSTNLLRTIDQALAVRPEMRFCDVAEMQVALAGSREEQSDETVIMAPVSRTAKPPQEPAARPVTRPPPISGPVTQMDMGAEHHWLLNNPPDVEPQQTATRRREVLPVPAAVSPHPPHRAPTAPMALLAGGGLAMATVIALLVVWLWPAAPTPELLSLPLSNGDSPGQQVQPLINPVASPPASGMAESAPITAPVVQPAPMESTPPPAIPLPPPVVVETAPAQPQPTVSSGETIAPPPAGVETAPVEPQPAVSADIPSPPPLINPEGERVQPVQFQDEPTPESTPPAPSALPEPAPVPAPALAPRRVQSRSAAVSTRPTTPLQATPKSSARAAESSRSPKKVRAKGRRDRNRLPPIVAAPAPARSAPAARSVNPWESPSTGFNNK